MASVKPISTIRAAFPNFDVLFSLAAVNVGVGVVVVVVVVAVAVAVAVAVGVVVVVVVAAAAVAATDAGCSSARPLLPHSPRGVLVSLWGSPCLPLYGLE